MIKLNRRKFIKKLCGFSLIGSFSLCGETSAKEPRRAVFRLGKIVQVKFRSDEQFIIDKIFFEYNKQNNFVPTYYLKSVRNDGNNVWCYKDDLI